jgi:dipeptidyl aminopeptidase/acylaminoacyl peptidase
MPYDIERYLNVRSAGSPSLGPDGELAFLLDTTGTPQVWRLDEPQAWPRQITHDDERVTFAAWSPERSELVFGMDEGGNEREQLFRLAGDGSAVHSLTATPDAKHRFGGWSHDGERIAFASNRREEAVFDVYVQGREESGDDAELVMEGDGWWSVAGWSPDDGRLALTKAASSFDQDVYVLDLETGERIHLTPHEDADEGDVRFLSVSWGPEGEGLYCCTDRGADTLYLVRLDAETGEQQTVVEGGGWNVEGISVDRDSGRAVYARNVEGYTELTVGELTGTDFAVLSEPDLPEGVAGGGSFGPEGETLAVAATASDDNTNVYLVDAETGESERWTLADTAGVPRESFRKPELVRYESVDGREIPAFVTYPGDDTEGPVPVIVSIHGGPESQRRPGFNPVKQYFLNRGYAYFEPNVRGSTGYGKAYTHLDDVEKRMDSVADVDAGVEWLTGQSRIDADRVVAMGGSYGGFMVLAALTEYPQRWAAGVDIVGIANFVTFLENTGDWRRQLREAEYGSLAEDRDFLESISPLSNIDAIEAPLLVLHGANDPRVPVGEAEQIAEEASEHVPTRKLIFEDEGHGFSKLENRIEAYRATVAFLDEHV